MSDITKRALAYSLLQLLNRTTLDNITIKDITDECGVARNTFYYHFQDIYDLLSYLFKMEADNIISRHLTTDTWREGCIRIADYLIANKKMVYHIRNSINKEQLEVYLYNVTDDIIKMLVKEHAKGLEIKESDIIFITDFYKYALVGLLMEWIRTGMKEEPAYIIDMIGKVCNSGITVFFQNCIKENTKEN